MGLKSKADPPLSLFKPVRGAPCKEELLWGSSDTFLFSVGVSKRKTNSLLLHQVSPLLFPTNVIFFLSYFRKIPPWIIVSSMESEERKLRCYWGFERYLMFQSGSEGRFFPLKVPVTGRWGKHLAWLSWGKRAGMEWGWSSGSCDASLSSWHSSKYVLNSTGRSIYSR